jgi:4-hydroxyproline epimerase
MHKIEVIDSHTGGEPTRVIVSGFPSLDGANFRERLLNLKNDHDRFRRAVINEPRSSSHWVGALLCEPDRHDGIYSDEDSLDDGRSVADFGVIFFNNTGYLHMCGHGLIGVAETLRHLGRITPGCWTFQTPAGVVSATLEPSGSVSFVNVPSYRALANLEITVEGVGQVVGDVAWGGNWFYLVKQPVYEIELAAKSKLLEISQAIQRSLNALISKERSSGQPEIPPIDHIELFDSRPLTDCDSRSFVLCPGGEYDRSPCGTGTSAKIACLAADEKLLPTQIWRQQSVSGSHFEASFDWEAEHCNAEDGEARAGKPDSQLSGWRRVLPTIRSRAFVTAEANLLIDTTDPFCWGMPS